MHTQPQDKSSPVFSNELLEERRANQWSFGDDWFLRSCSKLRTHRLDRSRPFLKMKFKSQITIQTEEKLMTPEAERFNGWAAMLGFVAAVGAYATTGQIIPGIF